MDGEILLISSSTLQSIFPNESLEVVEERFEKVFVNVLITLIVHSRSLKFLLFHIFIIHFKRKTPITCGQSNFQVVMPVIKRNFSGKK